MHLGIIGSGHVGGTLGRRFIDAGHSVTFGARDPQKTRSELAPLSVNVVEVSEVRSAQIIFLATPWSATVSTASAIAPLPGQIIVDCTNPIVGRLEGLKPAGDDSGGESVQRAVPQARVVKAFHTCGYEVMAQPRFANGPAVMPVCADDADARRVVSQLAAEIGFAPLDLGPLRHARYLEPMAMVWITRAMVLGAGRRWAFGLVSDT